MIKKYLVIGNPIEHSLSPKLHNYWLKENNEVIGHNTDTGGFELGLRRINYDVKKKKYLF